MSANSKKNEYNFGLCETILKYVIKIKNKHILPIEMAASYVLYPAIKYKATGLALLAKQKMYLGTFQDTINLSGKASLTPT